MSTPQGLEFERPILDLEKKIKELEEFQTSKGVDLGELAEVIERVSQLVGDHPEIQEMDINPFLAFPEGETSMAVDARFSIGPVVPSWGGMW